MTTGDISSKIFLNLLFIKKNENNLTKNEFDINEIENKIIKDNVKITNLKTTHSLKISNSEFSILIIENSTFKNTLHFKNCSFDSFYIKSGNFNNLIFENCIFKNELEILYCKCNNLTFKKQAKENQLNILGGTFKSINYYSEDEKTKLTINGRLTFINEFIINSKTSSNILVNEAIINSIKLEGSYNSTSKLNFKNITNNSINIENLFNDGKINFTNFNIENITNLKEIPIDKIDITKDNSIEWNEIKNVLLSNTKIKNINELYINIEVTENQKKTIYNKYKNLLLEKKQNIDMPNFIISFSSLGSFEFNNINLENYNIIVISSDLSSSKLINSKFPLRSNYNNFDFTRYNFTFNYLNSYYVYNDLYTSANKQNNVKDRMDYYYASQIYLFKHIRTEKPSVSKYATLIGILIPYIYSTHGNNWLKSIIVTILLIAFPMFVIFILSLENITIDFSKNGVLYFTNELLPLFPQFINPIHKIDFINENLGFWSGWIDLFSRIFIGIGIYETIRSFRRFIRQ